MKTKNLTLIIILSTLIASSNPCSGMSYMKRAGTWTSNFITRCWNVGVLATIYASMGKYDFNKITGLDQNKLNTYNAAQLQNAQNRVETMIQYGAWSDQLNSFFDKVHAQYAQAKSDEEIATEEKKLAQEADLSYDEEQAIKDIEELRKQQAKNPN